MAEDLVETNNLNTFIMKNDLKYKQLSVINSELFSQIKKIFIFSKFDASDVIFITNSDEVYGFGDNKEGRLGLGHNKSVSEPTLIPELCSKQVIHIVVGFEFMVALTETHEVYTCGYDRLGMLGNGDESETYCKPQKIDTNERLIVGINCCALCTYLLTVDNKVFWFGFKTDSIRVNIPTIVDFEGKNIIDISCGESHALALTDCGEVYSLGFNSWGQLGLGHNNNINSPQMIIMYANSIKKISAGLNHSLILTTSGDIYSFGQNNGYQLGREVPVYSNIPMLISANCKFTDIFAFENISMALNEFNSINIWGKKTTLTFNISQFQEAIDIFSINAFTIKPVLPEDVFLNKRSVVSSNRVLRAMAKLFNNPKNSDLKFKLKRKGSEDFDYIYCHKWFVEQNSEYFEKMFANNWSESQSNEIQINDFSYEAFYHFIRCLYTETIETENNEILIELLSITDQYLDEEMKTKCVQIIKHLINVQNVCSFYSSSKKFRSKELEDFCFEFMSQNIKLITKTEDYEKMDSIYSKELFTKYVNQ